MTGSHFDTLSARRIRIGPVNSVSSDGSPLDEVTFGDVDIDGTTHHEVETPGSYDFDIEKDDDTILSLIELGIYNTSDSEVTDDLTITISSVFGPVVTELFTATHTVTVAPNTSATLSISGDLERLRADGEYVDGHSVMPVGTIRITSDFAGPDIAFDSLFVYLSDRGWYIDESEKGHIALVDPDNNVRWRSRIDENGLELPGGVRDQSGRHHEALVSGTGNDGRDGNGLMIEPTTQEPTNPQNGWIEYADGTGWNPGSGPGYYGYEEGSWVKL